MTSKQQDKVLEVDYATMGQDHLANQDEEEDDDDDDDDNSNDKAPSSSLECNRKYGDKYVNTLASANLGFQLLQLD